MCVKHSAWYLVHSKHSINIARGWDLQMLECKELTEQQDDPAGAQALSQRDKELIVRNTHTHPAHLPL